MAEMYNTAIEDLEKIIASETSGLAEAIPEQDDRDLACLFVKIINHDARFAVSRAELTGRVEKLLDQMVLEVYHG